MIRSIIVDDNDAARDETRQLLSRAPDVELIDEASDGDTAFEMIRRLNPDLVLLDIEIPSINGLQLVEKLDAEGVRPHVVFITTSDKYAVQAFDVNAVDYLLKPVAPERMEQCLARVRSRLALESVDAGNLLQLLDRLRLDGDGHALHGRPPRLSMRKGDRVLLVDPGDVTHGYILDGVVFLATDDSTGLTTHRTLDELESDLDPERFWRVHRSYIVNIDHVTEVIPWQSGTYRLRLDDSKKTLVPLSRAQAKRLRRVLRW